MIFFNAAVVLPGILFFLLIGTYEKRIKKEFYGEPSVQDRVTAGRMLKEIDVLRRGGKYKEAYKMKNAVSALKVYFAEVERGNKVSRRCVRIFFNMREQIRLGGEELRAQYADFADYIDKACALFENNTTDL